MMATCKFDEVKDLRTKKLGITLFELLIAVAVIAILTAFVVPLMSMQMVTSKRAACAANLRQIGVAVASYTGENDGRLPVTAWNNLGLHSASSPGLIDHLEDYVSGNMKIFYCTAGEESYEYQATRVAGPVPNNRFHETGYYWIQAVGFPFNFPLNAPRRISTISPTKGVLAMCLHFSGRPVHRNRMNVLFADGHTEIRKGNPQGVLLTYVNPENFELNVEF